jgi:hypothetical protein
LPAAIQLSETPAIFHDAHNVNPDILDDDIFLIAVDPLNITADVLNDAALVPATICIPDVEAKVLDGAAIVYMLSTKLTKTFQ